MTTTPAPSGFDEYVAARWPGLVRMVCFLGADLHTAEDVVQTVLARCYPRWSRIAERDPDAYVTRALVNARIDGRRRRWSGELPTERLPDRPVADHHDRADDLGVLTVALDRLPREQRQVVVLRFHGGYAEAEIAAILGIRPGTVKSRASRALAALAADETLALHQKGRLHDR